MKNQSLPFKGFLITVLLMAFAFQMTAQDYHLALRQIVNRSSKGYPEPTVFNADGNGGVMEFNVVYYVSGNACPEHFRAEWKFSQNMTYLPGINSKESQYGFTLSANRVSGDCGEVNPWRNPNMVINGNDGGWSAIMNSPDMLQYKGTPATWVTWASPGLYFRNDAKVRSSPNFVTGDKSGEIHLKTHSVYAGKYVFFYIRVVGNSNRDYVYDQGMSHEIVYLYEIVAGPPPSTVQSDPCAIKAPDCSCCPGTIPVWNFKTNKPECLCEEGKVWDRIQGKCVEK